MSLDLGGRRLIDDLTLRLVKGDRIGIVGPNGAGKTTLLRLVTGELAPTAGKIVRGVQTKFAYFDQARTTLRDDWTVLRQRRRSARAPTRPAPASVTIGDRVLEMRAYLELFLFEGAALRRKVSALSGGERARVALALALKTGANVLLLDEPTNDLDIATLGSLAELIESWPGCVLVVSHDRFFLDRVVTSILAFEGEGKVQLYAGQLGELPRAEEGGGEGGTGDGEAGVGAAACGGDAEGEGSGGGSGSGGGREAAEADAGSRRGVTRVRQGMSRGLGGR